MLAAALAAALVATSLGVEAQDAATQPAPEAKPKGQAPVPSWARKGGPLTAPTPPPPPPAPPPDPAAQAEATAKEEARKHFAQGLALFDAGSMATALPEFLLSRSIYPTRAATKNAALCLRRLGRFDEALDMNEELLAFPEVTFDEKALAQKELSELRPVVGTIEIEGIQAGATISLDGKPRGTTPLKVPLHVPVGTRIVRIYKAGFETFEKRVEALGGKSVTVRAVLAPLELSGWLQIDEASGYNVDVLLNGAVVGKTPWRGLVATGEHLVVLKGDKRLGTQPVRVEVKPSQVTPMILIVEELASTLRAESKTKDGRVFVDGVFVGVGAWEGAVRTGSHRITVEANGFVTDERRVEVSSDKREVVSLELSAVKASTYWTDHPPFVELGGAFALSPSFGGPVAGCEDCQSSFAMGGVVAVRAGFMFTPMWSLGLDATGINAEQTVEGRKGLIDPIGVAIAPYEGTGDTKDVFTLRGSAIGASIAMHRGDRFPLTLRLGFGGFFGSLRDVREGTYTTHPPTNIPNVSPAPVPTNYPARGAETLPARGVYLNPEVRFGVRIAGKFELAASVSALVMLFPTPPSWVPAQAYIDAGDDGRATFLPEELTAPVIFVFTPGLVAAYRF